MRLLFSCWIFRRSAVSMIANSRLHVPSHACCPPLPRPVTIFCALNGFFFYICRNRMEMSPFFIWLLFYFWRNISPRTALHHGNDWFVTWSVSTLPLWFGTIVGHVSNSIAILALCWSRVDTAVISLPLRYLTGSRAPHWSSLLAALNLLPLDKTWGWLAAFLSSCNECDWYCFLSCGLSFLAVSSNTECLVVQGTWDSWSLHQVILEASLQLSREGDL